MHYYSHLTVQNLHFLEFFGSLSVAVPTGDETLRRRQFPKNRKGREEEKEDLRLWMALYAVSGISEYETE